MNTVGRVVSCGTIFGKITSESTVHLLRAHGAGPNLINGLGRVGSSRALAPILHPGEETLVSWGTIKVSVHVAAIIVVISGEHFDGYLIVGKIVRRRVSRVCGPSESIRIAHPFGMLDSITGTRGHSVTIAVFLGNVVCSTHLIFLASGAVFLKLS